MLGYVGEVDARTSCKQLKARGYQPGDLIGRDGVEAAYERCCAARRDRETVEVDPTRQAGRSAGRASQPGTVGDDV